MYSLPFRNKVRMISKNLAESISQSWTYDKTLLLWGQNLGDGSGGKVLALQTPRWECEIKDTHKNARYNGLHLKSALRENRDKKICCSDLTSVYSNWWILGQPETLFQRKDIVFMRMSLDIALCLQTWTHIQHAQAYTCIHIYVLR